MVECAPRFGAICGNIVWRLEASDRLHERHVACNQVFWASSQPNRQSVRLEEIIAGDERIGGRQALQREFIGLFQAIPGEVIGIAAHLAAKNNPAHQQAEQDGAGHAKPSCMTSERFEHAGLLRYHRFAKNGGQKRQGTNLSHAKVFEIQQVYHAPGQQLLIRHAERGESQGDCQQLNRMKQPLGTTPDYGEDHGDQSKDGTDHYDRTVRCE